MGWIADLVSNYGSDKNERISDLEYELDKFVEDSSRANHQITTEISDRVTGALSALDSIGVGNAHYAKEILNDND